MQHSHGKNRSDSHHAYPHTESPQRVIIKNGLILNPDNANPASTSPSDRFIEADIEIEGSTITALCDRSQSESAPDANDAKTPGDQCTIIDASGCWITPSFIDLCHYVREPGLEHKGTIASETYAAASAGFTHLVTPPTTQPVIDNPAVARLVQNRAQEFGYCQILPLGAMTQNMNSQQLSEMYALKEAGCIGIYACGQNPMDNRTRMRCLEYADTFDLPIYFRPNDPSLSAGGLMHEGELANRLGIPGIPAYAETIALARDLQLVYELGIKAHFSRLSCRGSVDLIAQAKSKGLQITCDVSLHHLLLTDQSLKGFNANFLNKPPFRSEKDRQALIKGLRDGTIDALCSNHQPHEPAAKMAPLGDSQAGLSTVDTFIPNLLALTEQSDLTLQRLITALTRNPYRIIQQADHNHSTSENATSPTSDPEIATGHYANLAIIDPNRTWSCSSEALLSKGQNCAEQGQSLTGKAVLTMHQGNITYNRL